MKTVSIQSRCLVCLGLLALVSALPQRQALQSAPWDAASVDRRIQTNRRAPLHIQVIDGTGEPVAGKRVHLSHIGHLFYFGAGYDPSFVPSAEEDAAALDQRRYFLRLMNYVTMHIYWKSYERLPGSYGDAQRLAAIRWLKDQGLKVRGHPVFWNQDSVLPSWLLDQKPDGTAVLDKMTERLRQLSHSILPELSDADVFNEITDWERFQNPMVDLFNEEGKVEVIVSLLETTRKWNPRLELVLNDYVSTHAYSDLLSNILQAGGLFDVIGQQSHMHNGVWSMEKTWEVLQRLSRLNRPVLFTELSVLSGPRREIDWSSRLDDWESTPEGEAFQADYVDRFYSLAYSHSGCMGVVTWNFSDHRSWMGAPVGFLRKDGTPKPAYFRLDHLINSKWRTHGSMLTDDHGEAVFPDAFEGRYRVKSGESERLVVHAKSRPATVVLQEK